MHSPAVRIWMITILMMGAFSTWVEANDQKALVRDLIKVSGLQHEIHQLPLQILAGFDRQKQKLTVEQHAAVRQAFASSFEASWLEQQITQQLESSLSQEVIAGSLKWFRSDLGRKVTALEIASSNPDTPKELEAFAKQMEKSPPAAERLQLIRRADQASNGTEFILDVSEALVLSMASAYEATLPAAQRQGLETLRSQLAHQREISRQQVRRLVWVSMLRSYRNLPEEELRQYVEFLESEEGLRLYTQTGIAFKGALQTGMMRAGRAMMDILKPPAGRKSI